MTSFHEPAQDAVESRYNSRLSRERCVVEREFGLKTRWRFIFLKAQQLKGEFVSEGNFDCLNYIMQPEEGDNGDCWDDCDTLRIRLTAVVTAQARTDEC